ncbi:MAG: hypothetical protein GXO45_06045 [Aquificae bacterium]|nr:hypothetical protein [Aquificota bacterium]
MKKLSGLIKKVDYEIKQQQKKLSEIQGRISALLQKKEALQQEYNHLNNAEGGDILSVQTKMLYMVELLKQIDSIEDQIKQLDSEAEKIRIIIREKNAEKKAVETYIKRLETEKRIEEINRENQLADEFYNRNR